jgi:arylformamidase
MGITSSVEPKAVAPSYWRHEYSPRATILDSQRYFDTWAERAARTRENLPGRIDVAYGSGARERLDVFRGRASSGTLIFIHGGYWRAFGKEDFSWVADTFVKADLSVVVLSYPLVPAAHMADISRSISKAISFIARELLTAQERTRLVIAGHSAGAQLAALFLASSAEEAGERKLDAIVCISGVFDLLPLSHAGIFAGMDMPPNELHAASPLYLAPPHRGSVLLALGADETREFHRQSERLADAWSPCVTGLMRIPGRNHFSVIDDLYDAQSTLSQEVLGSFKRAPVRGCSEPSS